MKRFLLLIMMSVLVSVGTWAATISGDGISGGTETINEKKTQTLDVSTPGALAAWVAANTGENYDTNNPFGGLGGSDDFYSLKISGTLSAEDFAALKSTTCAAFSRFPRIDMSEVTLASGATSEDVCNVVFGPASFDKNGVQQNGTGATFIVLPNGITSADDVTLMAGMKGKGNSALKVVGAYDGTNQDLPEIALYSFAENQLSNFSSEMMNLDGKAMVARLAGTYGNKDLENNGPVFGWTPPCIWDFTGATFTACTVNPGITEEYYAYDDPFCDGPKSKPGNNYQTNAFWYFGGNTYSKKVVDIKLPTGITELPPRSLYYLGANNIENTKHKAAYKAYYGLSDEEMETNSVTTNSAIIPDVIIPDNYTKIDYECGVAMSVKHLVVGGGVKIIEGGAFSACIELEDLDFGSGLSNCYLGDRAFAGDAKSKMKHIALSEGIVSLGNFCFQNAQHLESIRLPETLINMGNFCFDNCLALNSITIPGNVDKIGKNAFRLCPFTDIYLTTTDPAKIPQVWSAGTKFTAFDGNCTFHHGHLDGWEGGVDGYKDDIDGKMTWDEAAPFYFMNWNGMPVLHFPSQLAEKVRSQISSTYAMKTKADEEGNQYGLPLRADMDKRDNIPGADLGKSGEGKYTRDGWAQFMLMKEFSTDPGGDLYFKEYDDVWYTMCFPFDLSDEQLAGAFNETFNIVDFSAVEINKEEKTLTLHFNNVAVTDYKDTEGHHYKRTGVRETDPTSKFSYNVYTDENGQEYHHVTTSSQLSSNKTKTFAPGTSMGNAQANFNANHEVAVMIDGVLATAGHPYMIHPAIGVNDGGTTKKRCNFSGVEWKPQTQWAKIFDENSRTIDLGIKKTLAELPDSNYSHPGYSDYAGQKYTFIGNPKEYVDGAQAAIGDEPQVPEEPVFPVQPDQPENTLTEPTERIDEPEALTADEQELISKLTDGNGQWERGPWYGITEPITANYNDGSEQWNLYNNNKFYIFSGTLQKFGYYNNDADAFNFCKTTFNKGLSYATDYAAYQANKALWDAYNANQAAWNEYNNWDQAAKEAEYNTLKNAYDQAVTAHTTWENKAKAYKVQIPQHAYFLGRAKGSKYPKYYREKAAENYGGTRTTGLWPQFTAVIKVNAAAVSGIESNLDANAALSKGFEMAFNEDFEGEMYEVDEIKSIIEEAEKQGKVDVEYLDVVVNINGQVVRSGSTSLEGLPRGLYIVNGKKYFVK